MMQRGFGEAFMNNPWTAGIVAAIILVLLIILAVLHTSEPERKLPTYPKIKRLGDDY